MCFALLYANSNFHLSRNFNLQAVGDADWLIENFEFESIAHSIDELLILNVSRNETNWPDFIRNVQKVIRHCFMPVAVGGGIRTTKQARLLFDNGADKIVLNSAFVSDPILVADLASLYGSQSIVASIDFRRDADGAAQVFIDCGRKNSGVDLAAAGAQAERCGAGEIYLTSIARDGTGMGYDLQALELVYRSCGLPIIAAGGADTYDKLAEGLNCGFASAVSTAHLFNFMADGLEDARREMEASGIDLAKWNFKELAI